jgi:hypothetical protein
MLTLYGKEPGDCMELAVELKAGMGEDGEEEERDFGVEWSGDVQICTRKRVWVREQRACAADDDGIVVVRLVFEIWRFGVDVDVDDMLATSTVLAKYV